MGIPRRRTGHWYPHGGHTWPVFEETWGGSCRFLRCAFGTIPKGAKSQRGQRMCQSLWRHEPGQTADLAWVLESVAPFLFRSLNELVWIGLDWFGLVWIGLDWFGFLFGLDLELNPWFLWLVGKPPPFHQTTAPNHQFLGVILFDRFQGSPKGNPCCFRLLHPQPKQTSWEVLVGPYEIRREYQYVALGKDVVGLTNCWFHACPLWGVFRPWLYGCFSRFGTQVSLALVHR